MKNILIVLILLGLFSCSEKSNITKKTSDIYLFSEVYLKTDKVDIWKESIEQFISKMNQHESNKQFVTFQINDTIFFILDELNDYSFIENTTSPIIYNFLYLDNEYLGSISHIKSGLLILNNKFQKFQLNDINKERQYTYWEMCNIKPDKIVQIEENWVEWGSLHDSLQTGLKYMIFNGTIGFEQPFYMNLMFESDSIIMNNKLSKLWNEGKVKANQLFKKELPYYRNYKSFKGDLIPELSYWPE